MGRRIRIGGGLVRVFRWTCWIPAVAWLGMRQYVEQYDGWGRWAAAPSMLLPVVASAVFVGIGLMLVSRAEARRPARWDWIALAISALPLLWFAARVVTQ